MSKMKDLFIQMQNEDWERMPLHERAIIEAERRLDEEQLWLEIMQEQEYFEQQAKIIKEDDTTEEVRENLEPGAGPEHGDAATIHVGGSEHRQPRWELPKITQLALDFGKKTPDNSD